MKQFGRTVKKGKQWLLWHDDKEYIIKGDISSLVHGGMVRFYKKNLSNPMDADRVKLYMAPDHEFLVPQENWVPSDLFRNRLSYLRSPGGKFLIKTKSKLLQSTRSQLFGRGFTEVTTPTIIPSISEGRVSRFKIDFKGQDSFLAMTFLPYLNLLCYADSDRVFQIGNVFQSGQSNGQGQANEYLVVDWAHRAGSESIGAEIKFINTILRGAVRSFNKIAPSELRVDDRFFLEIPLVSYQSILQEVGASGLSAEGDQKHIPPRILESIRHKYNDLFWVYEFPRDFKPFYCETQNSDKGDIVVSGELWWKGFKIATTSLTQSSLKAQKERIRYLGLNIDNFRFYLDAMSVAVTPTFVSTINFERFIAKLLNFKTIKEAILFPRATRHAVLEP